MACSDALPCRNALISTQGIGKRPSCASREAAINPAVMPGSSTSASRFPMIGIRLRMEASARNMKNKPDMAKGWRKKVRTPMRTQTANRGGQEPD